MIDFDFDVTEQKPMINELMTNIASGFPDLYNGWASALPVDVQLKLKEALAWKSKLWETWNSNR